MSRICQKLDEVVETFRQRPVEGRYPYLWLDALSLKVGANHRIVSKALVIAIAVRESGEREVLHLLAQGLSNQEIGERLFINKKTVRNHVSNIFSKLKVADRVQAVIRARDAGLG